MAAEKTSGIVLKVVEFSETSCIVTIFTRDFGKITGMAKGARRRNSPFEAAIDLMALIRLVFLLKSNDALDLLTEAKLERRFRAAGADLGRFYAGQYLIELINVLTINHDPLPALFDLAEQTVIDLDEAQLATDLVLARFEMRALSLVGHQPQLDACVNCNRPAPRPETLAANAPLQFGLLAGGLLCRNCRPGHRSVLSIAAATSGFLQQLADPQADWQSLLPNNTVRAESRQLLNQFVSHTIGFRPKAQQFLKQPAAHSPAS